MLANKDKEFPPSLMIHELGFKYQVAIWALRMHLYGEKETKQVQNQFERALPPAASRVAFDSIKGIIDAVRCHGKQSLKFNCICKKAVTPDEQLLLSLMQSIEERDVDGIEKTTGLIVDREGANNLMGAAAGFSFAMDAREGGKAIPTISSEDILQKIPTPTMH